MTNLTNKTVSQYRSLRHRLEDQNILCGSGTRKTNQNHLQILINLTISSLPRLSTTSVQAILSTLSFAPLNDANIYFFKVTKHKYHEFCELRGGTILSPIEREFVHKHDIKSPFI